MNFNLTDIIQANQLIKVLFENSLNPTYLIDSVRKIRYANRAFSDFVDKQPDEFILHDFCQTIGCIYHSKNKGSTHPQCKICRLDELLSDSVEKEISVVREFYISNKPQLKYLQYNSFPIQINNETLLLVIIRDLSGEALSMVPSGEMKS